MEVFQVTHIPACVLECDRFCGIVVRVPGHRYTEVPGSIPGATRFSEK
jgi:hypothetical protein